jgi:hypothetical protein
MCASNRGTPIPSGCVLRWHRIVLASWCCLLVAGSVSQFATTAATWEGRTTAVEVPKEVSDALRAELQTNAVEAIWAGKPAFTFWLRKRLPLASHPSDVGKALDGIPTASLLGVVRVHNAQRDYRDDELPEGCYSLRFALQPQDGNHLGTSEFSYFAVLTPVKRDLTPDGIKDYKALVRASSKETATEHPIILSLRPCSGPDQPVATVREPAADHHSLRLAVEAQSPEERTPAVLAFELVISGKGKQ